MASIKVAIKPKNNFCSSDSETLYLKNLKTMPNNWIWRTKPVTYTVNAQGFRAPEWNKIDWDNSILIFGCSFVYGLGIDDKDTCSNKIYESTFVKTINLGIPGGSPMSQWVNSTILRHEGINPKGVVYVWPFHHRTVELLPNTKCVHYGPYSDITDFNHAWSNHTSHGLEYLRYCVYNTSLLWSCPVLHYHLQEDVCNVIPEIKHLQTIDKARDCNNDAAHPGPLTHMMWADIMISDLETYIEL